MLVSLSKTACQYLNVRNIGVKTKQMASGLHAAPWVVTTWDLWLVLGLLKAPDSAVGGGLGLFCLTLETFPLRPSGLLVSHYSFSINALKYMRQKN